MPIAIAFIQGLFELVGLGGFLVGYFGDIWWLMMLGGCLVVLDDVIEVRIGILNPFFPVLLAIVLANLLTPWYVGVFWASAAFKVLGIPGSLMKVFTPRHFAVRLLQRAETIKTCDATQRRGRMGESKGVRSGRTRRANSASLNDMEQHVVPEGGRYVCAYFPELMEPFRLIRRDLQAYRASGDAHRRKLEQDLAIADYTKAIEIASGFAPAYCDRGHAHIAKAEYDLAILDFTKAIELGIRSDVGFFERGHAYTKKREYDLAIADYTKVIETDPSSVGGYYYRGEAYTQKGEYKCAIPDFTKVIEMQPSTVLGQGAHYNLGCIYLKMGDTDSAMEHYDALKRLDENLAKGLLSRIRNMAEFSFKSNQQE